MVQTLVFFFFIGICALIFCKAEGVTFVDGIYFMIVTTLTIGFGDITPHTAVMKVLVFPFAIIGLSILAVIVTSIVRLLADRARRRKIEIVKRLKEQQSEKKRLFGVLAKLPRFGTSKSTSSGGSDNQTKRDSTLQEALYELREQEWKRERRANLRSMTIGLTIFFVFWFAGALIFHFVEVKENAFFEGFSDGRTGDMEMLFIFVICLLSRLVKG
jgi:potassium channel subfamily K, other eukaryote